MSTILEVILKTAGFNEGATAIKKVGDEATNTNNKLKTTASTVDQVSKNSTSLGSKLKAAGGGLAQIGTAASTTVLSVVSLQRSYRDLEDSQIAVDKTTRRVSLAQEAYRKATDAVAKAITSGGKGSKAYKQALLDQQQALAKVNIAIKDQGEAVERQGDINQDFWLSLGTTVLSTSSTIVASLEKIGGGMLSKLGGVLSGLIPSFGGIGSKAAEASKGLDGITTSSKAAAGGFSGLQTALGVGLAIGGAALVIQQVQAVQDAFDAAGIKFAKMKSGMLFSPTELTMGFAQLDELMAATGMSAVQLGEDMEGAKKKWVDAGGKLNAQGEIIWGSFNKAQEASKNLKAEIDKMPPSLNKAATSTDAWVNMMIKALQSTDPNKIIEFNKAFQESGQSTERYQEILKQADVILKSFNDTATKTPAALSTVSQSMSGLTESLLRGFNAAQPGKGFTGMTALFVIDPKPIAASLDPIGKLYEQTMQKIAQATKQAFTDNIAKAQESATANLQLNQVFATMGQTLSPLQTLMTGMSTSEQNWVAQTQASIAAENTHRAALLKLIVGMNQHGASLSQSTQMLELEARAALGDAQAIKQLSEARKKDTAAAIANQRVIGQRVKGYEPGRTTGGSKYVTYRNGKVIGYGPGTAPPTRSGQFNVISKPRTVQQMKSKKHAAGYQGTVHRSTMFIAGEGGRPEDVTVRPRGSVQRGGSAGGGGSTHITVSFEPPEFAQFIRYRINDNQGVVK